MITLRLSAEMDRRQAVECKNAAEVRAGAAANRAPGFVAQDFCAHPSRPFDQGGWKLPDIGALAIASCNDAGVEQAVREPAIACL